MQPTVVREPVRTGKRRAFAWDHLKVARTILQDEALQIFRLASSEPVTATELSRRCEMPIARCYRLLHKLESLGLIAFQERRGRNGIRSRFYMSTLRSLVVRIEECGVRTRVEVNGGATPLVTECTTTIDLPETAGFTEVGSPRQRGGADVVHFVDPRSPRRSRPRHFPIHLPAFLEDPLPRRPERR